MENDKIKKNGFPKVVIILIILGVIALGVGFAYARYVTSKSGQTEVQIARWNFKVTAGSTQSLNIDLADTRLANDTTEVDSSKVAPGTKGAIQLNVDASGSQVSLKYDIDLSLTQIPENLIFYSDAQMTNAIYKENGTIHLDGYFGANTNNKTETKMLYWEWPLETGSTQAEIDSNDLLDSAWMGDEIVLGIQATGRQVMEENPAQGQYAVTFDANGGTLQGYGNASQTTKMVTYGESYGELLTPTREGYRFVGWSRNLADEIDEKNYYVTHYNNRTTSEFKNDGNFAGLSNQKYIRIHGNQGNSPIDTMWKILENNSFNVVSGKKYILSFYARSENSIPTQAFYKYGSDSSGKTSIIWNNDKMTYLNQHINFENDGEWHLITEEITAPEGVTTATIIVGSDQPNIYGEGSYIDIANIQFTEDSSITPYYIQSSTEVVSQSNHTLVAKWEPTSNSNP